MVEHQIPVLNSRPLNPVNFIQTLLARYQYGTPYSYHEAKAPTPAHDRRRSPQALHRDEFPDHVGKGERGFGVQLLLFTSWFPDLQLMM